MSSSSTEKFDAEHASKAVQADYLVQGSEARQALEKKLVRKIDMRMSILTIIFILHFVDRLNVGAARLRGFEQDLQLKGQEFATIISVVYAGYSLMQIPSNMFLNWGGRPSIYLPICVILWGLVSVFTGLARNFAGAVTARFFLGVLEAAFWPGALFLLSKWYKREELGLRTSVLCWGGILGNAFGALIPSGILNTMDGKLGQAAWRWLFYIEGAVTVFFALLAMVILPDFPTNSRWFTPEERALAILRMEEDAGVGDGTETEGYRQKSGFRLAIADPKVWWFTMILGLQLLSLSFAIYFPTLTATLGYNPTISLVLCAPPWILCVGVCTWFSYNSDRTGDRCYHIMGTIALSMLGYIIATCTMNKAARYVSLFLAAQSYATYILLSAWMCSIFARPPSKRAVVVALTNTFSQAGAIGGSYIFPIEWGPSYRYSFAICIASSGLSAVMALMLREHLRRENVKMEERRANGDDDSLLEKVPYPL